MTSLRAKPFNISMDNMDLAPNELAEDAGVPISNSKFFKNKEYSNKSDLNRAKNFRAEIVEAYKSAMQIVWVNAYLRQGAMSGNSKVYSLIDSSFDCIIAESTLAEVSKLVSVASNSIKQPVLESISENRQNAEDRERAISICNSFIDKLYYENINDFTGAFSSSLKSGLSFIHVDLRKMEVDNVILEQISPYKCMFDLTKKIHEVHKGAFFLYEEFISQNSVRDMYGSPELEEALKVKVGEIDTFPCSEMSMLLDRNKVSLDGQKFSIKKMYNFTHQIKNEVALNHHKVTTLYLRNKMSIQNADGDVSFRNCVDKLIFVNNQLIDSSSTNLEYLPIVGFCPMEECSSNTLNERFQSLYDCIKAELLAIAILLSSIATTVLNNANSPIFIRSEYLADSSKNVKCIRNRVVNIKSKNDSVPIQDLFGTIPNNGVPAGSTELVMLLKEKISQKFNLITMDTSARSSEHEELKMSNQVLMSSSVVESLDNSILSFGCIMRDVLKVLSVLMPEKIQENVQLSSGSIDSRTAKRMSLFLNASRVILEESYYYTTKQQKDITKLEKVAKILGGRGINISTHKLFETIGLSQDLIDDVRTSSAAAASLQSEDIKIANSAKLASIDKDKAYAQELIAKAYKYTSEAKHSEAEIANLEIEKDTNIKDNVINKNLPEKEEKINKKEKKKNR